MELSSSSSLELLSKQEQHQKYLKHRPTNRPLLKFQILATQPLYDSNFIAKHARYQCDPLIEPSQQCSSKPCFSEQIYKYPRRDHRLQWRLLRWRLFRRRRNLRHIGYGNPSLQVSRYSKMLAGLLSSKQQHMVCIENRAPATMQLTP